MMKQKVYIALGSNINPKEKYIFSALKILLEHSNIYNPQIANFYNTTPVGGPAQDNFINTCCGFETDLSPEELLLFTQKIEKQLGKDILVTNGPRTIDLDILLYGNKIINQANLQVPHPRWQKRLFVIKPLSDITQKIYLPSLAGKTLTIDLKLLIKTFSNPYDEKVSLLPSPFYRKIKYLASQQEKTVCYH
jgi:2-amino-4-hydroxy-6-hydroxymethyldihydropteridine diphosphokinase